MRAPQFWSHDGLAARLLAPLGLIWDVPGRYRRTHARPYDPGVPVICVGNLVVGGAGKTPVAISIGQMLQARGLDVGFLSRGYGGKHPGPLKVDPTVHTASVVGDEPLLLAETAPTWVSSDRRAGARALVGAGVEAIVMDDGYQNMSLAKSISLLVVDGAVGFGNCRVMPAGPLREPLAAGLARADAVVIVGEDIFDLSRGFGEHLPLLRGTVQPSTETQALSGRRLLAFAGLARPEKLFETLATLGADLAETAAFPDHHRYTEVELAALATRAEQLGAELVTTAKDHVRLGPVWQERVLRAEIDFVWQDANAIAALLQRVEGASQR
ncbi:MAG: tetraacyldisaccharide 4'-kinase [Rhodospirillaceae bacterium]|nr:tetraacyldisaccharide 4'-kinase [Rhodospirillaceae bacterium]MBT6140344.1 tetraacyldisaccharide 4'-kinase [Rhodospirillaceae bacterium]